MKKLHSEIEIDATPETVWEVLLDFASYPQWNTYIPSIEGEANEGSQLRVRIEPPVGKGATFKPTVTEVKTGRRFEWLGRLGFKGVFDGRHRFEIEAVSGGTRLVQSEEFTGVLVPLLAKSLDRGTVAGFEAMNQALKERAESRNGHPGGDEGE